MLGDNAYDGDDLRHELDERAAPSRFCRDVQVNLAYRWVLGTFNRGQGL